MLVCCVCCLCAWFRFVVFLHKSVSSMREVSDEFCATDMQPGHCSGIMSKGTCVHFAGQMGGL